MILMTSVSGYAQLIGVLLIFVVVLVVTAFVTKYIGSAQKTFDKGKNIEVLEVKRVAPNKYVQIIRAGKHYMLVSVGQNEIHMLCELKEEELSFEDEQESISFAGILQKFLNKDTTENNEEAKTKCEDKNE